MRIHVHGGAPLNGVYKPAGNPNAAIALLAAALLTDEPVTLHNVPDTTGISAMLRLANTLGVTFERSDHAEYGPASTLSVRADQIMRRGLTPEESSEGGLLYVAPMLVRRQYARIELDYPLNRIRTHLEALRDLGLDVVTTQDAVELRAVTWDYRDIILAQTSVTATAIVMMLAACFGKETVIHNAASEPHIQELADLLERMGAQIHGRRSNVLRVFGKDSLHGAEVTLGPDHIETASVAAITALSGGRVQMQGIRGDDLRMISKIYRRLGINLDIDDAEMFIPRHDGLSVSNREEDVDSSIETAPWPGFPSDLVAVATVAATQARGTSLIHEKLFNNRLLFVDKLKAMGAQIVLCDPHRAIVVGPTPLYPIYMDTPDVRAGLGLLGAALIAQGESIIDNAQALRRNFNGVVGKLQALGAQIELETEA